jgi:Family of unknown function (DUF6275)
MEKVRVLPEEEQITNPERFQMLAKRIVTENYNKHRFRRKGPLGPEHFYVAWFSKSGRNWQAVIRSPIARSLLYTVAFDAESSMVNVDVYERLNNIKMEVEHS